MNSACPVHEWSGSLFGEPVFFKMTSVCGHVMTLDFNSKFNNWDKVDPVMHMKKLCYVLEIIFTFIFL